MGRYLTCMGIIDSGQQYESDDQAVERYRYLLRTAPPDDLERAHQEAFARLTPQQRQLVLRSISAVTPETERQRLTEDPKALARAATRAEMRSPGVLERSLAPVGGGLFSSLAGAFIGSSIAHALFGGMFGGYGANDDQGGHDEHAANDDTESQSDDTGFDDADGDFGDFGDV